MIELRGILVEATVHFPYWDERFHRGTFTVRRFCDEPAAGAGYGAFVRLGTCDSIFPKKINHMLLWPVLCINCLLIFEIRWVAVYREVGFRRWSGRLVPGEYIKILYKSCAVNNVQDPLNDSTKAMWYFDITYLTSALSCDKSGVVNLIGIFNWRRIDGGSISNLASSTPKWLIVSSGKRYCELVMTIPNPSEI